LRRRLDHELVRRGLAGTQDEAAAVILAGRVLVGGTPALKPSGLVAFSDQLTVAPPSQRYVSRGGEKLAAALQRFEVSVAGLRCLDAGAATGGFTDVLLAHGAAHVVAVDVGYGQLAWQLRTDPRVTVMERVNVRSLQPADLPYAPEVVVGDLSFISLARVLPTLASVAVDGCTFIVLIKPQFEAKRGEVERGGVVRDPAAWRRSIEAVDEASRTAGLGPLETMASPLVGPAGNVEFFLLARKGAFGRDLDIDASIRKAQMMAPASNLATVQGRQGIAPRDTQGS
jgi:23S rRNA (cytidine1920-2'-O)/16S rRNA (cytidine1409-2'-O)-methyltransferase